VRKWIRESLSAFKKNSRGLSLSISIHNFLASRERRSHPGTAVPIRVEAVKSGRDINDFIRFPKLLFRNQRCWIDPLDMEVKRFVSAKHPFRKHGTASLFVARFDGRVVGRILVSDDPRYNAQHQSNMGCFGMFHSIDNQQVANQLLDTAARWLGDRGRTLMSGPIDYSTNYATGLLIDGFDTPPRMLMNHNPPYYQRLLQNWGLRKAKDLYAWWFTRENSIDDGWRSLVNRLANRFEIVIRPIRMKQFDREISLFRELYNETWRDNWGFVKMTKDEFDDLAHGLRKFAVPELMLIAEVRGKPVGLAITIPDLNEAIAPLRGRLSWGGIPAGMIRLIIRMRHIHSARLAALGVVPGYRRRGVAEMLIQRTFDYGKDVLGYTGAELSWTLDDNEMINRAIERVGGRRYKTYRIYEKSLSRGAGSERIA
jgi:GNAT superfamily N-acetyltransferase